MKYAGMIIGICGSALLGYETNWKVWLAVFLMIWGNNFYERESEARSRSEK